MAVNTGYTLDTACMSGNANFVSNCI